MYNLVRIDWICLIVLALGLASASAQVNLYEVDRLDDALASTCSNLPNDCTLRGALTVAANGDLITFDAVLFSPSSPGVILVTSPLPPITQGVLTIRGNAQFGFGLQHGAVIDGTGAGAGVSGLVVQSNGNFLQSLRIQNFAGDGIFIDGGAQNTFGDACTPIFGNALVGNGGYGVRIAGETADGNALYKSSIGTADGVSAAPNALGGVLIENGADQNVVGTSFCGGPTIHSNGGPGVTIRGAASTQNRIDGADIGTASLPNQSHGVLIDGAAQSVVGPITQIIGNQGDGLRIESGSGNRVQPQPGYGSFSGNAGLGINLVDAGDPPNGVTPNDVGDGDTGANDLLNFPVITAITPQGGGVVQASGTACANCTVSVYLVDPDPSGNGEGSNLTSTSADGSGNWQATFALGSGASISAITTDPSGNSSEFAANVAGPLEIVVDRLDDALASACTAAPNDCTLRGALTIAQAGDVIVFDNVVFSPSSPGTIGVTSPLPALSQGLITLRGNAQFGLGIQYGAIIDGTGAGAGVSGLLLQSDGNTLRSIRIQGFADDGIFIDGGAQNVIGDACTPIFANALVQNGGYGVRIAGETADGNMVYKSSIGTVDGITSAPNALGGVMIDNGADQNVIGTSFCGGPTIHGNGGPGVTIRGAASTQNRVDGADIGTASLPNQSHGVLIDGAAQSIIGPITQIVGNQGDGLRVESGSGNRVQPQAGYGAFIDNAGLGINLVDASDPPTGVTPNDVGDGDTGANDLVNFPVITAITPQGGGVVQASGTACANCAVSIYLAALDASGHGEGSNLTSTGADSSGNWQATFALGSGASITAIATDPSGNTSEFAANVAGPLEIVVDRLDDALASVCTAAPNDCTLRGALTIAQPGDVITFDAVLFSPASPGVIGVTGPLPPLVQGLVTLRGNSQFGFGLQHGVVIDGSGAGIGVSGLVLQSNGNILRSLQIQSFGGDGVFIDGGAQNAIGDPCSPVFGNALVTNGGFGVRIAGEAADGNVIYRGSIGTVDGVNAAPNTLGGVLIENGADQNVVGTSFCGGPSIHANAGPGVWIRGAASTQNRIDGADIGTVGLPNQGHGIWIDGALTCMVGPITNVSGNLGDGLRIESSSGNKVVPQPGYGAFSSNGGLGINLVDASDPPNGVTLNDVGDGDVGANDLVNMPVIRSISSLGAGVFQVSGVACPSCLVSLYLVDPDPSGHGEGSNLSSTSADALGVWTLAVGIGIPTATTAVSAIATHATSGTSEFAVNANVLGFAAITDVCGNNVQETSEECDDGNVVSGDGCTAVCTNEFCGDGITQPGLGESCDDGNNVADDGCNTLCQLEFCGDGVVQSSLGETCDDSNNTNGDGCDAVCMTEVVDTDGDSIPDTSDNCPLVPNLNQADNDGDLIGDLCDPDDDNDTVLDLSDNCPLIANTLQADNELDLIGDLCDPDDDNDSVLDVVDNCPLVANVSQADGDGDLIGDACDDNDFHRADPNGDARTDIADTIFPLNYLFRGGPPPACMNSADANNDGQVDISDAVWTVNYLFLGGPPPPSPGPASAACGPDTEPIGQTGNVGCASYPSC